MDPYSVLPSGIQVWTSSVTFRNNGTVSSLKKSFFPINFISTSLENLGREKCGYRGQLSSLMMRSDWSVTNRGR